MNPPELRYSKEHEWLRVESDGTAVLGITEFATESLGDVVFVELPDVGAELGQFSATYSSMNPISQKRAVINTLDDVLILYPLPCA